MKTNNISTQTKIIVALFAVASAGLVLTWPKQCKAADTEYSRCLKEVNKACHKEHNAIDDKDGFIACLDEKYKDKNCEGKSTDKAVPVSPTITGSVYRDTLDAAQALINK